MLIIDLFNPVKSYKVKDGFFNYHWAEIKHFGAINSL